MFFTKKPFEARLEELLNEYERSLGRIPERYKIAVDDFYATRREYENELDELKRNYKLEQQKVDSLKKEEELLVQERAKREVLLTEREDARKQHYTDMCTLREKQEDILRNAYEGMLAQKDTEIKALQEVITALMGKLPVVTTPEIKVDVKTPETITQQVDNNTFEGRTVTSCKQ